MTGVRKSALLSLALAAAIPATARGVPVCATDADPGLRLVLNIPAARLDVLEGELLARSYRVAVGTPDHPTPVGSYRVDRVIWNPWWVPPPFEWARKMKLTPPGPDNPTGRVKLFFGYYLFLHGTPLEESLGRPGSHGCVRLANEDAIELARAVHAFGTPAMDPAVLDSLEADTDLTRTIHLDRPVDLSIVYERVEVRDGRLAIHPDPYGLAPMDRSRLFSILSAAGVAATDIDPTVLDVALERARDESVSLSLDDSAGSLAP